MQVTFLEKEVLLGYFVKIQYLIKFPLTPVKFM